MQFDIFSPDFSEKVGRAVASFRKGLEKTCPLPKEIEDLSFRATGFDHCTGLEEEFVVSSVSSSGEFPILFQEDVHVHFASTAATAFKTLSRRQHKLDVLDANEKIYQMRRKARSLQGGDTRRWI